MRKKLQRLRLSKETLLTLVAAQPVTATPPATSTCVPSCSASCAKLQGDLCTEYCGDC